MTKYFLSIVIGITISSAVYLPILFTEQARKFELGLKHGFINGKHYAAEKLKSEMKSPQKGVQYKVIYSVKTTDVVVYKTNGIKTIGVIE